VRIGPEDGEAISFMQELEVRYPEIYPHVFHVPNETRTHIATAKRLKRMGVRAGVPDYFIAVPVHGFHGLFIELKAVDRGSCTDHQKEWLSRLALQGYSTTVAYGAADAIWVLTEYLLHGGLKTFRTRKDARGARG